MEYVITSMKEEQLSQAAELETLCFTDPWSTAMLREHWNNPCSVTLAAADLQGTLLGYAGLLRVLDEGYITNVAVHPGFRRCGIASALLDALETLARKKEWAFLTLEVRVSNYAARALYEKQGFMEAGLRRGYYRQPKEDAMIMTKWFDVFHG